MRTFQLSDGTLLPQIGFGTYQVKGDDGSSAIQCAIEAGYRFFDTASLYETERVLGRAIRESGRPRDEFIIETKLWIDEMDDPAAALERSLKRLETDYADIYMTAGNREAEDEERTTAKRAEGHGIHAPL